MYVICSGWLPNVKNRQSQDRTRISGKVKTVKGPDWNCWVGCVLSQFPFMKIIRLVQDRTGSRSYQDYALRHSRRRDVRDIAM